VRRRAEWRHRQAMYLFREDQFVLADFFTIRNQRVRRFEAPNFEPA
jgi:hypothetical protein